MLLLCHQLWTVQLTVPSTVLRFWGSFIKKEMFLSLFPILYFLLNQFSSLSMSSPPNMTAVATIVCVYICWCCFIFAEPPSFPFQVDMSEEAYQMYSTMETRLIVDTVRRADGHIGDLHWALDNTLSLLIHLCWDFENYIQHNPCQVCITLLALGREFACGEPRGAGEASSPAPAYEPSLVNGQIPGSVGEGVEGLLPGTPSSLPSLIPNSSFLSRESGFPFGQVDYEFFYQSCSE